MMALRCAVQHRRPEIHLSTQGESGIDARGGI